MKWVGPKEPDCIHPGSESSGAGHVGEETRKPAIASGTNDGEGSQAREWNSPVVCWLLSMAPRRSHW